jgi:hypothetical protein
MGVSAARSWTVKGLAINGQGASSMPSAGRSRPNEGNSAAATLRGRALDRRSTGAGPGVEPLETARANRRRCSVRWGRGHGCSERPFVIGGGAPLRRRRARSRTLPCVTVEESFASPGPSVAS